MIVWAIFNTPLHLIKVVNENLNTITNLTPKYNHQ